MAIIFDTVSLFKENQRFFLNSTEIPGIQTLDASYEVNATPLKHLGGQNSSNKFIPVGPQIGKVSISNILIGNDLWLNCTGETGVNGYIMKNFNDFNNNFSFYSGYLNYYHSQCNLGQLHRIDATFDVYGNIGRLDIETPDIFINRFDIQNSTANIPFKIPTAETTTIILDDIQTNKILSYDVGITVNRNPIYAIGQRQPIAVKTNWPIEVQCSFQIEIDSYAAQKLNNFPALAKYRNVSITARDIYDNSTVLAYNFSGMLLVSEAYKVGIDNAVIVEASYRKSLMGPPVTGSMIEDAGGENDFGGIVPIIPLTTENPNFYWKMDELTDSNRVDSIAGLVLEAAGGNITHGIGKIGNAVNFFAQVNQNPGLYSALLPELAFQGVGFDFCFWTKFNDLGNSAAQALFATYRLFDAGGEEISRFTLDYLTNVNQLVIFIYNETDSDSSARIDFTPTLGTWYFIRAFYNHTNGNVGIQINNSTITLSTNSIILPITPLGIFQISQLGNGAGVYNDYLEDEFGFWLNQRLSDVGATFVYNAGNGRTYPF